MIFSKANHFPVTLLSANQTPAASHSHSVCFYFFVCFCSPQLSGLKATISLIILLFLDISLFFWSLPSPKSNIWNRGLNIGHTFHLSPVKQIVEETSNWQLTKLFLSSVPWHSSNSCSFPRCIWMLTVLADMLFLAKCNVFNQAGRARVHKFIMQMLVVRKASRKMLMRGEWGLASLSNRTVQSLLCWPQQHLGQVSHSHSKYRCHLF